jgi:hypothetical protein
MTAREAERWGTHIEEEYHQENRVFREAYRGWGRGGARRGTGPPRQGASEGDQSRQSKPRRPARPAPVLVPIQLYQAQASGASQPAAIGTGSGSLAEVVHYSSVSIPSQDAGVSRVEDSPVRCSIPSPRPATLPED